MTVNLNATSVQLALTTMPVAPTIEGSAAGTLSNTFSFNGAESAYYNFGASLTGRYGMRVNLAAPLDFTGHDFATLAFGCTGYSPGSPLDTVANGGIRIYFVDGAGNHAGYNLYGALPGYDPGSSVDGWLSHYNTQNFVFSIARARTPAIASGILDWSNITAIEVTTKTTSNSSKDFHLSRLVKRSAPFFTGTETLKSVAAALKNATTAVHDPMLVRIAPLYLGAAAQININVRIGLTVGNGATATNLTDSNFAIGFENLFEFSPLFFSVGPWVQLDDGMTRAFKINQGVSDILALTDGSLASAGGWQWELSGSGVATCTRVQYFRYNGFRAAHGTYIDCAWNEGATGVDVTTATTISGGLIRDAATTAMKILDGAGDYSGLELSIDSASAIYDIELGAGGAGTYQLPNIQVPAGYTLRVHNNSPTNAVVLVLPLGMPYETSTAGGTIAVEVPEVTVSIEASALISGSRVQLYDLTAGSQLLNTELTSDGLLYTAAYSGDKVIRLRADHASKLPLETAGVLTASGLTFLDVQVEDGVYTGNGIDGSLVTEFVPDNANIEVDINDPDGVTNVQRLYAWLQWYMTTEEGVASDFFGSVSAIDSANYQIDQTKANIRLDNISAMPVRVVGGNLTRKDGSTVIAATSGSIQLDPGKAYTIETGISGLTAAEADKLDLITSISSEITVANGSLTTIGLDVQATQAGISLVDAAVDAATTMIADNSTQLTTIVANTTDLAVPPTAEDVSSAVWANAAVSTLADKTTVDLSLLEATRARQLAQNRAVISDDGETVTIYNDDNTTILLQFSISADKTERQLV